MSRNSIMLQLLSSYMVSNSDLSYMHKYHINDSSISKCPQLALALGFWSSSCLYCAKFCALHVVLVLQLHVKLLVWTTAFYPCLDVGEQHAYQSGVIHSPVGAGTDSGRYLSLHWQLAAVLLQHKALCTQGSQMQTSKVTPCCLAD